MLIIENPGANINAQRQRAFTEMQPSSEEAELGNSPLTPDCRDTFPGVVGELRNVLTRKQARKEIGTGNRHCVYTNFTLTQTAL